MDVFYFIVDLFAKFFKLLAILLGHYESQFFIFLLVGISYDSLIHWFALCVVQTLDIWVELVLSRAKLIDSLECSFVIFLNLFMLWVKLDSLSF